MWNLSERGRGLTDSAIRALSKRIATTPGVVSFAGGAPSPATFPEDEFARAFEHVIRHSAKAALQYGPTDGFPPLRAWIADALSTSGRRIVPEQILITSGSQQGLDLVAKVLLDPADTVAVETPTYLGALQAFGMYFPRYLSLPSDDDGLVPEEVEPALRRAGAERACKMIYAIPTFQNPTGRTLTPARRVALADASLRSGVPLIEDDPYAALAYDGQTRTTLLSLGGDNVVYLGSFSKVLSPGIRLGYIAAPLPLVRKLEMAKQGSDLHTSTLMQHVVFEIIKDGFLRSHVRKCQAVYRTNAQAMQSALESHLRGYARWTQPAGGMFFWLELAAELDTTELLDAALAAGVAYVPGGPFFATSQQVNTMRLCFSTGTPETIARGIDILGKIVGEAVA